MLQIQWIDDFSVGDAELDRQHRKWIDLIDRIQRAVTENQDSRIIQEIVDEMEIYTRYHFRCEERMLAEAGYSDLQAHQETHAHMTARICSLAAAMRSGIPADRRQVVSTLWQWLAEHILNTDQEYRETLISPQNFGE